ncbi:hypothetical protein H0G86_008473 [Trichoderma simmonsii]|uniref:Secreted protein n=1 Tax=Trichoderma simmonsii TaxID=1491479 RepID=A0A8G0LK10_9HYPO|nr:hypothetical protein H0G86_008473 [Trichoderma simmonsii]
MRMRGWCDQGILAACIFAFSLIHGEQQQKGYIFILMRNELNFYDSELPEYTYRPGVFICSASRGGLFRCYYTMLYYYSFEYYHRALISRNNIFFCIFVTSIM